MHVTPSDEAEDHLSACVVCMSVEVSGVMDDRGRDNEPTPHPLTDQRAVGLRACRDSTTQVTYVTSYVAHAHAGSSTGSTSSLLLRCTQNKIK
ncbi:hypothetical protein EYF80_055587 [Liparis tanakae]|uniref:Uncharacterized protein n=1 Tax=Liparis tanakae TaxID=230148 RepID=A0A4Z2EZG5_9TELE|nr:hypothetical protein EYF80_055587 [Liparis tanakae]